MLDKRQYYSFCNCCSEQIFLRQQDIKTSAEVIQTLTVAMPSNQIKTLRISTKLNEIITPRII